MANTDIKFQLFRVHASRGADDLENLLAKIKRQHLASRNRNINGVEYRLEDIGESGGLWYLNFVKNRAGHGPGRFDKSKAMRGFNFNADQSFGEDTACVYDPARKFMVVQYNHIGVRHSSIMEYLSNYNGGEDTYDLMVKLEQNMERKFKEIPIVRRLELGFDITKMNSADRATGRSLAKATKIGSDLDADKMYITLSISDRKTTKTLSIATIRQAVEAILPLAEKGGLIRARAYGGDEPPVIPSKSGSKIYRTAPADFEVIDLLEQLVETSESLRLGADHRVSVKSRWGALKTAHATMRSKMR